MYKNIIFDLDNTLCECSIHYNEACKNFGQYQAYRTGHTAEFCISVLKSIDIQYTGVHNGFSKARFPNSFAAASLVLDQMDGGRLDLAAKDKSHEIGNEVFTQEYKLYDDVYTLLEQYTEKKFNLYLLTKGDQSVQSRKIVKNKLYTFFDKNKIYINLTKTPEHVEKIITDHKLSKSETIMVGDSLKDDINSAITAGIDACHVDSDDRHHAYDEHEIMPTFTISHVTELPKVVKL